LRAIAAPFFLAAVALLLDRSERRPKDRLAALACGCVLGLSIYGYSSDRAIGVAFAGYVLWRVWRASADRLGALLRYGWIAGGAVILSIPNLIFLIRRPADFLSRGSYVFRGGFAEQSGNLIWSILFPLYLPASYHAFAGPGFQFDGVAAGFLAAGFSPLPIVIAVAFGFGLWRTRKLQSAAASFLVAAWIAVMLFIGPAGPSPTRLLILFPFFAAFAAAGFAFAAKDWPMLRIPIPLTIAAMGLIGGAQYIAAPEPLSRFYAGQATAIGEEAAQLTDHGERVLCVIAGEAGVVRYLTYAHPDRIRIVEFYQSMPDAAQIPFDDFKGGVLLLEHAPQFAAFESRFPPDRVSRSARFDRIRL
jgi:hypothetical protein